MDLGEFAETIRAEIQDGLSIKTGWGRNEITRIVDAAITKAIMKAMREPKLAEKVKPPIRRLAEPF
jgi:hypothetical protein